MLNTEAAIKKL